MDSRRNESSGRCSAPAARDVLAIRTQSPVALSALVLDLDHVLYDASPWQRWLLQLLNRIGLQTHYEAFYCAFERDYLDGVYRGQRDYWDALRAYLIEAGVSRGRVEEVLAAGHGKHRELWQSVRPFPGVVSTLEQLATRGVRFAVLSNAVADKDQFDQQLKQLGLRCRFDVVLSSRELRIAKPSPEAYQAVIAALDLPPERIGFVGHATLELAGAGLAGLTTFAINHADDAEADAYLDRFERLLSLVASTVARQRVG